MRIGLGDTGPTAGQAYDSYCYNASPWNPFAWIYCAPYDISNISSRTSTDPAMAAPMSSVPAPPPPKPPDVALVSSTNDPNAIYAGTDSSGNPIYAVPQTPQANMDQWRSDAIAYLNAAAPPAPATDCTNWWNKLTSSDCGGSYAPLLIGAAVIAGLLVINMMGGRRR